MTRRLSKEEWQKKRRRERKIKLFVIGILFILAVISVTYLVFLMLPEHITYPKKTGKDRQETLSIPLSNGEEIKQDYLTPNRYSRPQKKLKRIKGIVVHYTANPGTTAENNRNYFEGLAKSGDTYASSHFIIGMEGEILQCIPLTEESYASNDRNDDTVSIECCHPDKTGKFKDVTYDSLVSLTAALCEEYNLNIDNIIRHYDVTGKLCPLYFVQHEDAWQTFKSDVKEILDNKSSLQLSQPPNPSQ